MNAYLSGMIDSGMDEGDPCNPACIADSLGNNVGDIASMGADLCGSFAVATCAALVAASVSEIKNDWNSMLFPFAFVCWGFCLGHRHASRLRCGFPCGQECSSGEGLEGCPCHQHKFGDIFIFGTAVWASPSVFMYGGMKATPLTACGTF